MSLFAPCCPLRFADISLITTRGPEIGVLKRTADCNCSVAILVWSKTREAIDQACGIEETARHRQRIDGLQDLSLKDRVLWPVKDAQSGSRSAFLTRFMHLA